MNVASTRYIRFSPLAIHIPELEILAVALPGELIGQPNLFEDEAGPREQVLSWIAEVTPQRVIVFTELEPETLQAALHPFPTEPYMIGPNAVSSIRIEEWAFGDGSLAAHHVEFRPGMDGTSSRLTVNGE